MSQPNLVHHEINYIEIPTQDMKATQSFYGSAFAWEFNDYGPDYSGIAKKVGDGEMGGICRSDTISNGGLLVILYSADLESSLTAVKNAGGEITMDIVSFPGGRRFQFRDPNGHELAVWSDKEPNDNVK